MKKRIFAFMLAVVCGFIFTACKNEKAMEKEKNEEDKNSSASVQTNEKDGKTQPEPIAVTSARVYLHEYAEDSFDTLISGRYTVINTHYEDKNSYPGLQKALEAQNNADKKHQEEFFEEQLEYAKEAYESTYEVFNPYEVNLDAYVRRADTLVTSILYNSFYYSGGMHGSSYFYGKNYDTATGKVLKLDDVVKDKDKLCKAIEELERCYPYHSFDNGNSVEEILEDEELYSWTLDYNGITFYFPEYSLSNYNNDMQIVTVTYENNKDALKEKYTPIPKAFGVGLTSDSPFYFDVTGDGEADKIWYAAYASDYSSDGELNIYINDDNQYIMENWFFNADATFLHTADGKNYIYVEFIQENDYRETYCYEITDEVYLIDKVNGGARRYYDESYTGHADVITNPESFYLERITHHLSTGQGYKEYRVGANGLPKSDDKIFKFGKNMTEFTMLTSLEAKVYDEKKDKVTNDTKKLKKGETVFYYGTDNEKLGYLMTEDGEVLQVETTHDEDNFLYKIDEISIEEIFDGVFYAG